MTDRNDSDTLNSSSLQVFTSHMAYLPFGPHQDHGMLNIEHIRVNYPARWGSGSGAVIGFIDDHGSLNQLNLQQHHVDQLLAALLAEVAK